MGRGVLVAGWQGEGGAAFPWGGRGGQHLPIFPARSPEAGREGGEWALPRVEGLPED